jgi:DNA-binding IclR family transcriptional regulator
MTPSEIEALVLPDDLVLPDKRVVRMQDFVADCIGARGISIVATSGLINSFTQCLASPIFDDKGQVQATICLVLPMDITDAQRAELQQALIASSRKISMDA